MSYRIIQWGTGNVGKHALRTIVERPDFELVGLRVYNPDKVGKDAGVLLGLAGRRGARHRRRRGDPRGRRRLCLLLPARVARWTTGEGRSTTSVACSHRARTSCRARSSTTRTSARPAAEGAGAGYLLSVCSGVPEGRRPSSTSASTRASPWTSGRCSCRGCAAASTLVRHRDRRHESLYRPSTWSATRSASACQPMPRTPVDEHNGQVYESAFYLSMRMLADAIGVELDEVRYHREVATTDRDVRDRCRHHRQRARSRR